MEFRILGPLEVWEGDRRLPLGGAKHRALLAILILNANRVVATDRLIELLWGDEPSETVNNTLQVSVSQLRKVLEPDHVRGTPYRVLVSQEPGYLLRVSPAELDLGRFEQLREEAKRARLDGHLDVAAASLREALSLWRGPPLADIAQEPYAIAEASRLNAMRLQTVEDRIVADMALGRHADLIGELETLVAEHPLRERFRAQLMLALYRSGRQAEASDVFHKTRAVLIDEVGIEPGSELQRLLKAVLKQDPALELSSEPTPRPGPRSTTLPMQLTSFVGRASEVTDVTRLLSKERLVTLVGPGGVGKTRLAVQAAGALAEATPGGTWLIELASLTDPSLVPQIVANSVGLREQAGSTIVDTIILYLQRRPTLLVLDNCEHLVDASARLIDTLLRVCPTVRVLATSREPLRVAGETVWRVPSLSVTPGSNTNADQEPPLSEAVRLFCERAVTASPNFTMSPDDLALVAGICQRLDGIPLAIELAAARLTVLSLNQIATRLDDRFRILKGGDRTALHRHQTLEAAIDWSYELLSAPERALLGRLSVFAGGFSLDALESVCVGGVIELATAVERLSALVDKSLVVAQTSMPESRYRLLETIRRFAQNRLAESGEDSEIRARHFAWFTALAKQAEPGLKGPNGRAWLKRLGGESDNLRAALEWGSMTQADNVLPLANALKGFWLRSGLFTEGRQWLKHAIDASPGASRAKAEAFVSAAHLTRYLGDNPIAVDLLAEGFRLYRQFEDPDGLATAFLVQGLTTFQEGHHQDALPIATRSVEMFRQGSDRWNLAAALNNLGFIEHVSGDRSSLPREHLEEGLLLARATEDDWLIAFVVASLGEVAFDHGDIAEAWSYLSECGRLALRLEDKRHGSFFLDVIGRLAVIQHQYDIALHLFAAAASVRSDAGLRTLPADQAAAEASTVTARSALPPAEGDAAWRAGGDMGMEEALEFAIVHTNPHRRSEVISVQGQLSGPIGRK